MHPYTLELLHREKYRNFQAEVASVRLVKIANENKSRVKQPWPRSMDDVLQKVSSKFIGVYHSLYQKNRAVFGLNRENSG